MIKEPADAGEPPILNLSSVTIRRGRDPILSDVSLSVARGSIHVIAGPNGAGKSTLLLAALGQISFAGTITARWLRGGRIGYVPQSFVVDRTLPVTVAEFLALTRQKRPIAIGISRKTRARVDAMLDGIGLRELAHRPLAVLSGGELRRVLLAHALDPLPELLMLDEPATGLDAASSRWLEDMLLTVRQRDGVTVLMVSHDLTQAQRIADRVTVLDRVVLVDGTAAEALERHIPGVGA
jgi:zinc transport system ATP-binding protein